MPCGKELVFVVKQTDIDKNCQTATGSVTEHRHSQKFVATRSDTKVTNFWKENRIRNSLDGLGTKTCVQQSLTNYKLFPWRPSSKHIFRLFLCEAVSPAVFLQNRDT